MSLAKAANDRCGPTAANLNGWGVPARDADFADPSRLGEWFQYDSVGHIGNGRRTPAAISVANDILTITGDGAGNSGGLAWWPGQTYGRWEVCAASPSGSASYHPVLLLWPDSENWPLDGEIDFMEIYGEASRQLVSATVHHLNPDDPSKTHGPEDGATITIDATQWHSWAVEWTPGRVVGFVDGVPWFDLRHQIPSTPMHLCMQLDNFGGDLSQGGQLNVDWARQYVLP